MLFLHLFYTFFKIGLFGFGGGYAMLSMIQGEVVTRYGWLTPQEFTDIVAISQMTPGPIGINSATYVGYSTIAEQYGTSMGVLGSCVATFAVVCFVHPDAHHQQILSEISEAPGSRSRIQRTSPGGSRTAGIGCAGADEHGELQFAPGRYVLFHHQYHHLPCSFHRNKKI